jgi:serine/threonine-protein kinase
VITVHAGSVQGWCGDPGDDARMTLLAGRYELLHPVWRDALGTTWVARDRTGWPISVRLLPAALTANEAVRTRFRENGPLLLSLHHENLAPVRDLIATDEQLAIASDAVDGVTLRRRLREGRLPRAQATEIEAAVTAGLAALHEAGVTHGLLAPETVVLPRRGGVRLTDVAVNRLVVDSALASGGSDEQACRALLRDVYGDLGVLRGLGLQLPVRLRVAM